LLSKYQYLLSIILDREKVYKMSKSYPEIGKSLTIGKLSL
jgi:hypothetical protein